jgi:glycosyltransferase involved in cell wall biosynthesis
VVYSGCSLSLKDISADIVLPKRFLLFVGHRTLYKNFIMLVRALRNVMRMDPGLQLVCVGGGKFSRYEQYLFRNLRVEGRLLQMEMRDSQLAYAYSKAVAFVLPSMHEGFGMPVLEAFQCGCPVVCSRVGGLTEIAGEAALFFEPKDIQEMAASIERVALDADLQAELRRKGSTRAQGFSWRRCGTETLRIYEAAVGDLALR